MNVQVLYWKGLLSLVLVKDPEIGAKDSSDNFISCWYHLFAYFSGMNASTT